MAKPTELNDEKNPNNKKPFEFNQNLLIIVNNVILIVVFLISMFVMYSSLEASMDKKIAKLLPESEQSGDEEGEEKKEGLLLDLGDFLLNLADVSARRYLKVDIAIELSKTQEEIDRASAPAKASGGHGGGEGSAVNPNAAIIAEIERYKPAIRDAVISVLSNKTSDELSSSTGKELAKEEILEMVNNIFEGNREVLRVSFGQFIIQ